MNPSVLNALTVDVEDYFHVGNFAHVIDRDRWDDMPEVAPAATLRLLDLFAEHQVHGTFFVLGWFAQRHPDIVRAIAAAGHEVACHGFAHQAVDTLSPSQFREDVHRAKAMLEDQIGGRVIGYRAPSFTINPTSEWALDVLIEEGFTYDSSLYPGRKVAVGYLGVDRKPVRIRRQGGSIVEVPLTRLDGLGGSFAFSGGGHFRLFPYRLIRRGVRHLQTGAGVPLVFYFHPWEIVPDQPRVRAGLAAEFKHYVGLGGFEHKLRRLLADFRFGPVRNLVAGLAD
jgi:polysaccharide deacetylase family protein (PEP-CTERM system associated)